MVSAGTGREVGNGGITWKRFSRICHSFLLWALLAYSILRLPLLLTICSAVKGRLVYRHLGSLHHLLTSATSLAKSSSSRLGSTAGLIMLLEAMLGDRCARTERPIMGNGGMMGDRNGDGKGKGKENQQDGVRDTDGEKHRLRHCRGENEKKRKREDAQGRRRMSRNSNGRHS